MTDEKLKYLQLLGEQYPTLASLYTEIARLSAQLSLPKGTEHFMSDIHGEYEAFCHIMNNCSGVIREKVQLWLGSQLTQTEADELCTLIYYPQAVIRKRQQQADPSDEWFRRRTHNLVYLAKMLSSKYTRDKVRREMAPDWAFLIDELMHFQDDENAIQTEQDRNRLKYHDAIVDTVIQTGSADGLMVALTDLIKRLAVDRLHVVGDIFDRGPRADSIMDILIHHPSVDIEWGNHDILWMGAASGSRTLVATVLANSIHYNNLEVVETGYGISLRPLSVFANEVYQNCDVSRFQIKLTDNGDSYTEKDKLLSARMHKAITVMLFKLEGQKILRHPEYGMEDRLLLDKIDYENKCITIGGTTWPLEDVDFPTVDRADPYALSPEEESVIDQLTASFRRSEKLQRHVRFLYSKGSLYKIYNGNLLFHGCIPLTSKGELMTFRWDGQERKGKEFLDFADMAARQAYYYKPGSRERQLGVDFLWFLWAGRNSPIFGRDRMTTFERRLIADEAAWAEPKNAYYSLYNDPAICDFILREFGLSGPHCHIINGHVPVKAKKGESPIKGGGRLIVIDGGFCKAYQKTTGIAGYTLIANSHGMRLMSHQPFTSLRDAQETGRDIHSQSFEFAVFQKRKLVSDTDQGKELRERMEDLTKLLQACRNGQINLQK